VLNGVTIHTCSDSSGNTSYLLDMARSFRPGPIRRSTLARASPTREPESRLLPSRLAAVQLARR
jgi:hypothetical protein